MERTREYSDEPSGPFPKPPDSFEDGDERTIELRAPTEVDDEVLENLIEMYDAFDPVDRAQGIPPTGEERIRNWLESIVDIGVNVIARHDGDAVGHATLVPDSEDPANVDDPADIEWELAIFVLQDYQRAGIGTQLLEHLLGHASEIGIKQVWLTIERWNGPAIALYERVGFHQTGSESFEQEMTIRLE